jgi:UDP-2,3-diacylglucosamine pyrophosphatase LpxH
VLSLRAIVISDVHLGYERSDNVAFEQFVDWLLTNRPDKVILLGDIFDFWRRSDSDLLIENESIVRKLLQLPLTYVHGNHDYSMLTLSKRFPDMPAFQVKTSEIIRNENSRFVLRHGYDLEVFTSMETVGIDAYEAFSEAMCHAGQVGGTIASWVWDLVEFVKGKLSGPARDLLIDAARKPAEIRPTLEKADAFAKSAARAIPLGLQPSDILIFGHTHRPFKDSRTANTGSWIMSQGKTDHTYVEITDQSFQLNEFSASREAMKAALEYRPLKAAPKKPSKKKR